MRTTTERRHQVLVLLCQRRFETISNLAFEFNVDQRTIRRDINILSLSFPLYTTSGNGGGVHMVDGFQMGTKYLTDIQCELLERLLETHEGEDKEVLHSIIKTFKKPEIKSTGKK